MKKALSILLILHVLLVFKVYAKDDVKTLLGLSLQQLLQVKIETASLTEKTVATAPAAMTVFTRAEIERLPVNYLHELLQFVPGYQVTRELDYSYQYSLSARARKTGASAREILFLLDGVPANNPRNGNAAGVFLYPVNHIERVEVMRGPGSALYGSNAITGVVNIITIKGVNSLGVALGENNGKQLDAFYHTTIDEWRVDLSVHVEEDDGQGYLVPDTFSANNVYTTDPISQKKLNASVGNSEISFQVQYREVDAEDFFNTGRISNEYNFSYLSSTFANVSYQFQLWQDIESKLSANFLYVNTRNGNQSTPPGAFFNVSQPRSDAPLFGYGEFKSNRLRVDWQNSKEIDDQTHVLFGLEYRKESIKEALGYTNFDLVALTSGQFPIEYFGRLGSGVPIADITSLASYGLYGQYQKNFENNWLVTAGFRYDHYERFPSRVSTRLSLVKGIDENHFFKLIYGEAYRIPNFSEVGFRNTISVKSNPNLEHEIVKNWDVIWLSKWASVQIQIGLFDNQYVHPITSTIIDNQRTFINAERERSRGAELEVQWQPSERWFYRLTASHLFSLPVSAYREAEETLSVHVNYQFNKANINLAAVYASDRNMFKPGDTFVNLPSYWLIHSKTILDLTERWRMSFQIKNMLDKDYQTPASGNSLSEGIPNRGREWGIKVTYLF